MGFSDADLDSVDKGWKISPEDRRELLNTLEEGSHNAGKDLEVRSITNHVWDSKVSSRHRHNGFSGGWERTSLD